MKRSGLALTRTMIQAHSKFSPTALLFEEGLSYFAAVYDDIPCTSELMFHGIVNVNSPT